MSFAQIHGLSESNWKHFNEFCLWNLASFRGCYIYLLTNLSMIDAVQTVKKIGPTGKISYPKNFLNGKFASRIFAG